LASGPQGTTWTSPPLRAVDGEPVTATEIGRSSIVIKLLTQLPGNADGVAEKCTPGMPISAMPRGNANGPAE
jgi:hypothetical protein